MHLSENCAKLYSIWDVKFNVHMHTLIILPFMQTKLKESRAIAGITARCRCKFILVMQTDVLYD